MIKWIRNHVRPGTDAALRRTRDTGASAVEYGLMVAAIAAVIVGVVFTLGGFVADTFQDTSDCIELRGAAPAECPPAVP
jgi:pilus assembly protein Flp/PilA